MKEQNERFLDWVLSDGGPVYAIAVQYFGHDIHPMLYAAGRKGKEE